MIIVNADDWGLSTVATDTALRCYEAGRITSVSAMVFMEDSERAAALAKEAGVDVGLHLNLTFPFTAECPDPVLIQGRRRIASFLSWSNYSVLLYNPMLREDFRYVYRAQAEEFFRLYGRRPSHVDGHQHKHLCANIVFDDIIPSGEKLRRNYTFRRQDKGFLNRLYRRQMDLWLSRRYTLTDYFFALPKPPLFKEIAELSANATMEIMAHPARPEEYDFLMGDDYFHTLQQYQTGSYSMLCHMQQDRLVNLSAG